MNDINRPCPFCDAQPNVDGLVKHEPDCYVMVHFYSTPRVARDRKAWNTRPAEDRLRDEIKRLTDLALKACDEIGRSYTAYEAAEIKDQFVRKIAGTT